jgi:hypothetical protein
MTKDMAEIPNLVAALNLNFRLPSTTIDSSGLEARVVWSFRKGEDYPLLRWTI